LKKRSKKLLIAVAETSCISVQYQAGLIDLFCWLFTLTTLKKAGFAE
jgi:hypothetical protein